MISTTPAPPPSPPQRLNLTTIAQHSLVDGELMAARKTKTERRPRRATRPYIVGIANDLSEYAAVRCFATSAEEAEDIIAALLERNELSNLKYDPGDDREGPYTCNVDDDHGDQPWIETTIKAGKIVPPMPFKLQCPHCKYDGREETRHGGTFRYLTDQTTYRDITRFVRARNGNGPRLKVEGNSQLYYEDEEKNDRLECRSCLKEFPFPKTLQVEFI